MHEREKERKKKRGEERNKKKGERQKPEKWEWVKGERRKKEDDWGEKMDETQKKSVSTTGNSRTAPGITIYFL